MSLATEARNHHPNFATAQIPTSLSLYFGFKYSNILFCFVEFQIFNSAILQNPASLPLEHRSTSGRSADPESFLDRYIITTQMNTITIITTTITRQGFDNGQVMVLAMVTLIV